MTSEGRNALKQIVKYLLNHVEVPATLTDFLSSSVAERNGEVWTVYVNGETREGAISSSGATEYEAKENAWAWFSSIIEECKNS